MESQPELMIYTRQISDDKGESTVYLTITKFENAIQAALYDKSPRLGSMTLAYPIADRIEQQVLFQGKHEQLSRALAMMLVRKSNRIVYGSVNLSEYAQVQTDLIRDLVDEFYQELV